MRSNHRLPSDLPAARARRTRLRGTALALTGLLLLPVVACTGRPSPSAPSFSGPAYTLKVLASSELADMAPILGQAARATGVTVRLTPTGSLTGAQTVIGGKADATYDAVRFASDNYLEVSPGALAKFDGTTEIMSSPVILGLLTSAAHRLGWIPSR